MNNKFVALSLNTKCEEDLELAAYALDPKKWQKNGNQTIQNEDTN